jgi:xanthine dehydrogenase/oxidase
MEPKPQLVLFAPADSPLARQQVHYEQALSDFSQQAQAQFQTAQQSHVSGNSETKRTSSDKRVRAAKKAAKRDRKAGRNPEGLSSTLEFEFNGEKVTIENPDPTMKLNDWIRRYSHGGRGATGTKHSCGEAGCGACTVLLAWDEADESQPNGTASKTKTIPTNSCIHLLCSVHGMRVTTVEGTGGERQGFSKIQKTVAAYNGTQCGFCTPGMVMQMESLLAEQEEGKQPTEQEIEDRFDGNLCRCTGYRSILAAMKTFAGDYSGDERCATEAERREKLTALLDDAQLKANSGTQLTDIEELCASRAGVCKSDAREALDKLGGHGSCTRRHRGASSANAGKKEPLNVNVAGALDRIEGKPNATGAATWFSPTTRDDLYALLARLPFAETKIVVGNTSDGVYPNRMFQNLISLRDVADTAIHQCSVSSSGLVIGSAVTINDWIAYMKSVVADKNAGKWSAWQVKPFSVMLDHLHRVANTPVRASGTWAGNLAMCHNDNFLSDICVMMMAAGATLNIGSEGKKFADVTLTDFLKLDMTGKFIESVHIGVAASESVQFSTYKTMLRHVNSHALVNAGGRCSLDSTTGKASGAVVVFGGIGQYPARFPKTEAALNAGSSCFGASGRTLLQTCLTTLDAEVSENMWQGWNVDGRGDYRKSVAATLFYKFFLSLQPESGTNALPANLKSAIPAWPQRGVSSGTQAWETDPAEYPLSEPVEKLSALTQTSGEARYADDVPAAADEIFVSFVLSDHADAKLVSIDKTAALAAPGIVEVYTADVLSPEQNKWGPVIQDEVLLATDRVSYNGQIVAIVCGTSQVAADNAVELVKVTYSDVNSKPILTNQEAIAAGSFLTVPGQCPPPPVNSGNIDKGFAEADKIIDGTWEQDSNQYHFYMETQSGRVQPLDNAGGDTTGDIGLAAAGVRCTGAMQDACGLQVQVAKTLGIPQHLVEVETTRSGGGFGGKGSRNLPLHMLTAVAAHKLGKPARFRLDLHTNTRTCGKRNQFLATYKVGLDKTGRMTALRISITMNSGWAYDGNGGALMAAMFAMDNCYYSPNTRFTAQLTKTNTPPNTSTRGPGWVVGTAVMEHIITHIGTATGLGADRARELNFYKSGQVTPYDAPLPRFIIPDMWSTLRTAADWDKRSAAVAAFNKANRWVKKGIVCCPIKFGAFWSGASGTSLLNVFLDGTVAVSHGGCEIGQGIHTKVVQAVAYRLGLPLDMVRCRGTSTEKTPNMMGTGGSITSAMMVASALDACDQLQEKLKAVSGNTWQEKITAAYGAHIDLGTKGWFKAPSPAQGPQNYQAYSVGIHEVTVDCLTGWVQVEQTDILQDVGTSMNVLIDVGQVEGAFMMGLGLHLTEQTIFEPDGKLLTEGTWEYKPPSALDIPKQLNVTLLKNTPNPAGIVHSKVVGEPPLCQGVGVLLAVQQAVAAARADNGSAGYFSFNSPATVARTQQAVGIAGKDLTF